MTIIQGLPSYIEPAFQNNAWFLLTFQIDVYFLIFLFLSYLIDLKTLWLQGLKNC